VTSCGSPHTYDYVLHSFGRVEPEKRDAFEPTKALMKRYWLVDNQKAMITRAQMAWAPSRLTRGVDRLMVKSVRGER
jgi:hypothetical protein